MIVQVRVKTNSEKFKVDEKADHWVVHLRSAPEHNKANLELIKEISKKYESCRILKGLKSKNKTVEISGV